MKLIRRHVPCGDRWDSYTGSHIQGLYVVESRSAYKIGVSANLSCRLKAIDTNCPDPIRLLVFVPFWGTREESMIHSMLDSHRRKSEWFNKTNYTRDFVQELREAVLDEFNCLFVYVPNVIKFATYEDHLRSKQTGSRPPRTSRFISMETEHVQ